MLEPVAAMKGLFEFLLDVESIEDTVVEKRIIDICGKGHKKTQVYTLKEGTGNLYRNIPLYTND